MNIVEYVIANYESLPKSTFDEKECVIVREVNNSRQEYGHHSYEGIGIDRTGQILWCYSSGCSCNGTAGVEHSDEKTVKILIAEHDLSGIDPANLDFASLVQDLSSY